MVKLINAHYAKFCKLRRSYNRDKNKAFFKGKHNVFKEKYTLVFDAAACICSIVVECTCNKTPDLCECEICIKLKCKKQNIVPVIKLKLVYLQRKHGIGKIGGVDAQETEKITKRFERKSRNLLLTSDNISNPSCSQSTVSELESEEEDTSNEDKIIDRF
ncbi:hypothetical protein AVEN_134365-1 [Araneus ventricosus]|uniref:Uncharacterized protein n=1 Tax=Araneus ventricosus TaxID=182803 RepID=A0A4Y2K688_ARAVE|nr:hypothetical protein AVEN_134365-1 [Araneus ventricosus]